MKILLSAAVRRGAGVPAGVTRLPLPVSARPFRASRTFAPSGGTTRATCTPRTATATASSWSSSARASTAATADNPSAWRIDDLYLAHLALTDIDGQRFRYYKRLNRSGPGIAGASFAQARVWNGNWEARGIRDRRTDAHRGGRRRSLHAAAHAAQAAGDPRRERRQPEGARGRARHRTTSRSRGWSRGHAQRRRRSRARHGWTTSGSRTNWKPISRAGTGSACSWTTARS